MRSVDPTYLRGMTDRLHPFKDRRLVEEFVNNWVWFCVGLGSTESFPTSGPSHSIRSPSVKFS